MLFKTTKKEEKKFSKKIKINLIFLFKKKGFQKTNSKNDERTLFLFRCQITEIQKIYSWRGLNKCFGVKKKGLVILFERTRLKKKKKKSETKKGDRTKKSFTKRDEQMKKVLFFEKIKEIFFLKKFRTKKKTEET